MMSDEQLRIAAFNRLQVLCQVYGDEIPWSAIAAGFECGGDSVLFANRAVGIFKPRQLHRGPLSIKTTMPRAGRVNIYDDAEGVDGSFIYSLQGSDPNNHYNRALKDALEDKLPIIYFYAVSSGLYKAIFPCFVESIDSATMTCRISVGISNTPYAGAFFDTLPYPPTSVEKKYAVREAKVRLHQASFREMVLSAYSTQCAMSKLPVPELLEAAHIIPDSHELGAAEICNGVCLSRIHHRAFDSNLIGIDPDYKIHISERLLQISDGPMLEQGIKALHGSTINLPKNIKHHPRKDFLEKRFSDFQSWQWD